MSIPNELKVNVGRVEEDLRTSAKEMKDRARALQNGLSEGLEDFEQDFRESGRAFTARAKEKLDTAQAELREISRKVPWKVVAGTAVGLVALVASVIVLRRRARGNLLQRSLREGKRYAMLVPEGWNTARKSAEHVARESERLWDKVPTIRVELKK